MSYYPIAGTFVTPGGGTNGASVDGWRASRFDGAIPAEGQTPPSGAADTTVAITGTGYGGPGSFQLYPSTNEQYYVRIQYEGSTYWQLSSAVVNPYGVAGGQVNSVIVDSGGMVLNVTHPEFGAVGNGETDDTDAILFALEECVAGGGGTLYFPPGNYLVTSTINIPVSTTQSTNANNIPQTPIYLMPPIRITGGGGNSMPRGDPPTYGAIINFNPTGPSTLFNCVGEGTLEIDHMGFVDYSSQENLYIFANNTVTNIHDNAFHGNNSFTSAWTDVIQYGANGGTAPRGDTLGIYQGQVSRLAFNSCTNIRHLASLYSEVANVRISHNGMYNTCGSNLDDAPILCVGPGCVGNFFEYNDFEMGSFDIIEEAPGYVRIPNGYSYAIMFEDGYNNTLVGNNIGDANTPAGGGSGPYAQAAYYFSAVSYSTAGLPIGGSYGNVVLAGTGGIDPAIPWGAGGNVVGTTTSSTVANLNIIACPQFISGGAGGVMYGPVVAAGAGQFFMQAGTIIVTTNAGGQAPITFPAEFPNGVVSVMAQSNGDNNVPDSAINFVGQVFYVSRSGFTFYLQNTFQSSGNVSIAITWSAIGF